MFQLFVSAVVLLSLVVGVASASAGQGSVSPQVTMVKRVMPAVVGIGLDRRSRIGYRFSGDNSFWEEFQKQYKREQGELRKKGKPQWDTGKDSFKPEDIDVSGSGFIIDKDGTVITAEHVINGHKTVYITTWDAKVYRARVMKYSREYDVAVLKIENGAGTFPVMPMGDSDKVEVAEPVFGIGNPFGITFSVSSGIVSALNRKLGDDGAGLIQTDTPLNPGNSGGPLINMDGEVIGVNHAIYNVGKTDSGRSFNVGIAFAVPINRAKELITAHGSDEGDVVYIGISLLQKSGAIVIDTVDEEGPAARAGIEPGDRIVAVEGKKITDRTSIIRIIKMKKPGDTLILQLDRRGNNHTVKVLVAKK